MRFIVFLYLLVAQGVCEDLQKPFQMAHLRVLNKNTLKQYQLKLPINQMFKVERLEIKVRACKQTTEQNAIHCVFGFIEIWERQQSFNKNAEISSELAFSNWLNNIENRFAHPEYEVQILACSY